MKQLGILLVLLSAQDGGSYADPAQLDLPFPAHSHLRQPWRGWLETRSAADFLQGIGINYNVPGNDELAVRLLAEAGIRAVRKEVGWGSVNWEETGTHEDTRLRKLFGLFKRHSMRPTILLNCHQGVPCPLRAFDGTLMDDAAKGATKVRLADTSALVAGRSGLSGLSDYWAAEAIITSIDPSTGECLLSKPLPKELKAGKLPLATLKYLPLHPPGTPEFDETVGGWIRYAMLVGRLIVESGIDDFDFEVYNELTFGTKFLDIRNYYPDRPKPSRDFLHEGGACWELMGRINSAVKKTFPKARTIWGFSNTTFFHTPVDELPPGTGGQSYHPYGTGTRKLPEQEYHREHPKENVDGFTPTIDIRLPEGIASTFIQTESIMRLLNPGARDHRPRGVERFRHYMTEHGVLAGECGVNDERGAWTLKTKCALRSYCLWLHKGIDVLHFYAAWYKEASQFGILPVDLPALPPDARFDEVAPSPLKALRAMTKAFEGAEPLKEIRPLRVDVAPVGEARKIFDGPTPLRSSDALVVLPWQKTDTEYVVGVYVMTWDGVATWPEERFRMTLRGATAGKVALIDPVSGREIAVRVLRQEPGLLELELPVVDTPRLVTLRP
ncbi:MAG TPA: hypothetical protein VG457_17725 [Planctomycetota bacterium]|jgi:hypothetical protein|nr:hypothetical protein [Planctomycetota bacterium]